MSALRDKPSVWIVAGVLVVIVWMVISLVASFSVNRTILRLGSDSFRVTLALTNEERERGLSSTQQLGENEGMMLVYEQDDRWPIWMKDMNYPIDIIWIDSSKRITYIVKNAEPSSYPQTIFQPNDPARYVLEVPGGTADRKNVSYGDKVDFDLSSRLGMLRWAAH